MEPKAKERLEEFLHRREILKELRRIAREGQKSLVVAFDRLLEFDMELAKSLLDNPVDFLDTADEILGGITKLPGMRLRVMGLDKSVEIRKIRAGHVGKFIQVEGILTRAGEVKPEATEAVFKCRRCGEKNRVLQVGEFFREPLVCVSPDSKVLLDDGFVKTIDELKSCWKHHGVMAFDAETQGFKPSQCGGYVQLKPHTAVFKLSTLTGRSIIATGDHPFWTFHGWRQLRDLRIGDKVAVHPHVEVEEERGDEFIIINEAILSKLVEKIRAQRHAHAKKLIVEEKIKELKKRGWLPLSSSNEHLPIFARLLGHLFGDGFVTLSKHTDVSYGALGFTGAKEDLELIRRDLDKLGVKYSKIFTHYSESKVGGRTIRGVTTNFVVSDTLLLLLMIALGAPTGVKADVPYDVPSWVKRAPRHIKHEFLAAYFGSEGCAPTLNPDKHFSFDSISLPLSKLNELLSNARKFLSSIRMLLKEFGVESRIRMRARTYKRKDGKETINSILYVKNSDFNVLNFLKLVGYKYCVHKQKQGLRVRAYLEYKQATKKKLMIRKNDSKVLRHLEKIENALDYVASKKSAQVKDISEHLGFSISSVYRLVRKASELGFLKLESNQPRVRITAGGMEVLARLNDKKSLWLRGASLRLLELLAQQGADGGAGVGITKLRGISSRKSVLRVLKRLEKKGLVVFLSRPSHGRIIVKPVEHALSPLSVLPFHEWCSLQPIDQGFFWDPIISIDQVPCEDVRDLVVLRYHSFVVNGFVCHNCENPNCGRKGPFDLVIESSEFRDWQSLCIQEPPEKLRGGRMPRRLDGIVRDDFVDKAVPGNHVMLTGILRVFQEGRRQERKKTFRKILFVSHIEVLQKGVEEAELTPEDKAQIKELAKDPWVRNKIIQSIAPSIYGHDAIKEAIALQLFGCEAIDLLDGTRIRGDTHVLLTGDPGVAKSQILKWAANVAPRGLYTSGMKATGAGLCVAPDSLIWVCNGLIPISDLVENHFGGRPVSEGAAMSVEAIPQFNSRDNAITSLWKIPSPREMIEIHTQYGKRIEVTPETKIMTEAGWKEAKELTTNESVILPINYGEWDSSYSGITHFYPATLRIKNRVEIFKKISPKIKDKRALARILGIPEDKMYYRWLHENVRGAMTLGELRKICAHFKIDIDKVLDGCELRCQLRYGIYFKLPTKLSPTLAYFVGLIAGDGSLAQKEKIDSSTAIRFSNNDLKQEYIDLVRKLFDKEVEITPSSRKRAQNFRFGNRAIFELLKGLGVQKSKKLFIPREIICNKELTIAYLRGLFDADGSVYDRKNHRSGTRGQIELTTVYKEFAEQIQNTLFRLGIPAYITEKESKTTVKRNGNLIKSKKQYRIYITQNAAIDRFAELIGFSVQRKKEKLKKIVGRKKSRRYTEYVPAKIKKVLVVPSRYRYVYDMTVKGSHSFIANGILVHNTAAAVRDEISGGWALEAGALVIADGGLASIDEFEKMRSEDSSSILESLEQQTISVAKAGIVATLNTRTAVLAAANPKYGRFEKNLTIAQQVPLDPVILSRFDLIFIMRDEPHADQDRTMAHHILEMHRAPTKVIKPPLDLDFLRKIIIYARQNLDPKFDDKEAMKTIEDFFVDWRKVAERGEAPLPITVRQLEAIVRLAKANARMRLSDRVTVEDANRAINLIKRSLQETGIDTETGKLDIDVLMTGKPKSQRDSIRRVLEIIERLEGEYGGAAPVEEIKRIAESEGIRPKFVDDLIDQEKMRGHLYEPKPGMVARAVK